MPVIFLDDYYKVYDPRPEQEYIASIHAEKIYEQFIADDVPNKENIGEIFIERKLWGETLEKEADFLAKDKADIIKQISGCTFKSREKKYLEAKLKTNEKRLAELHKQKNSLATNTAEYLSKIEKYKYIVFLNTVTEDGKRAWGTWEKFDNEADNNFIIYLIQTCFFNNSLFNESAMRELARTDPWRLYWRTATKTGSLFNLSATEMTEYQRAIVSWSMLYDNIYESVDCPDEKIINDDDALDMWLEQQSEKRRREKNSKNANDLTDKYSKYDEIGIVVDSPEDAKNVYELNSQDRLAAISNRQDKLLQKGIVQESEFADSQQKIKMKAADKFRNSRK